MAELKDSYDKSSAGQDVISGVLLGSAVEEYARGRYSALGSFIGAPEESARFLRLLIEEERHTATVAGLSDREETMLEKLVAGQIAYITRLAEFHVYETVEEIRQAFAYLLADHLTHHWLLGHKLSQKEGLSPLAQSPFRERQGRSLDAQRLEPANVLKTPYNRQLTPPVSKVRVRLALAQEKAIRKGHLTAVALSKDRHLHLLCRAAASADDLHIAMLASMIDRSETRLEEALLVELSEIAALDMAATAMRPGPLRDVFVGLRDEDSGHFAALSEFYRDREGREPVSISHQLPTLNPVPDVDGLVDDIVKIGLELVSSEGKWTKAA